MAPGIVHLGPGAFFRAFVAPYTADAVAAHGGDWGITAVSLQSPRARDQLGPQGGAYTSVTMGPEGEEARVIEVIQDVLVAPEDPHAVQQALVAPETKIVTLTITEKGYRVPDLSDDDWPRTAIGLLVTALGERWRLGRRPITILSCDNLPDNGAATKAACLALARRLDETFAQWVADNIRFPSCMVDRITPATTQADLDRLEAQLGYRDEALVLHEPFRQWVIEDNFAGPRPAWEAGGAQFVRSVGAHEAMKLRCLNGTHSALAYLGYLGGHEAISDAVADPVYAGLCRYLWDEEILPSLDPPEGEDLPAYTAALLGRYQNPAIRHRTWQIAMDGSQKLPQRILGTIADNLAAGRPIAGLALVVAGWMRYVGGVDEAGADIDVRDPMAAALRAAHTGDPVANLLTIEAVFEPALAGDARFRAAVATAYDTIVTHGARAAIEDLI
ncbi:mannitol dehydrogenase family protein [Candidatus Rhodobacter oscarellae]